MTTVQFTLPDDLAQRAQSAGLLSDHVISQLLDDAMRRHSGARLRQTLAKIDALGLPPMSEAEVQAEIVAARAERHAAHDADRR